MTRGPKKKRQDKSDEESKKREKDLSKIKCYACGEMGHYANKCPSRQTDSNENEEQEQEETRSSHVTWNANTFTTYQVNAVQQKTFGPKDVLLDNQANISVVRPELLRDVQDAEQVVKINGVGGHQFTVTQTGYLDPLFRVYASEDTHANILSLSEVEDRYAVTYVPQKCFIVHLPGHDMEFVRKDGMYVAEWDKYRNTGWNTTVEMKEKQVQDMYMSQVEDGIGTQDAYVHVKLKKKKNEAVIEGLVVTDDVAGE